MALSSGDVPHSTRKEEVPYVLLLPDPRPKIVNLWALFLNGLMQIVSRSFKPRVVSDPRSSIVAGLLLDELATHIAVHASSQFWADKMKVYFSGSCLF